MKEDSNSKHGFFASLDIPSLGAAASEQQEDLRHFRIFADYGTDFIWLNYNDPTYDGEGTYIDAEDALSNLPKEVVDNYDAWVETYTTYFEELDCDYSAKLFPTMRDEVAWNVAGFLLAWRIAMAPHVGSVQFGVYDKKYLLRKGEDIENKVTCSFLEDQGMLLDSTVIGR